jgi:predicted permease
MSIVAWLKRLVGRRLDDEDLQDEIRAHLAIAADERVAGGADRQTARHASLKDFGNVTLTREAAHRVWTPSWVDTLRDLTRDVRYAVRSLSKHPAFSLTVVAVLTLGIGLNATVFTMLKGMALNPLGGVDTSRLVVLFAETGTGRQLRVSYPDYPYLRDQDRALSGVFGSSLIQAGLGRGRTSRPISAELVTGNYFQVLGVRAALGRTLLPSDETAPGRHPVVVISDSLWRSDFGADPDIVGKPIEIDHYMLTVVGVADPAFHGTIVSYDNEAYIPVMMAAELGITGGSTEPNIFADRSARLLFPHGNLRSGTTLAAAVTETDAIWAALSQDRPLTETTQKLKMVPFRQSPTGGQTYLVPTLLVVTAMGVLVLLIACANIAGLVLVRGLARRGEIAVRLALGATRTRIVRLLVVETLVLAVPGAALGVLLASRGIPWFVHAAEALAVPQRLFFNIEVDRLVIGFAVLVACGSALVFGFVPALQTSRVDLVSVINEDASPRGAARGRLRTSLVVAQVAVSLLLLVGAGLVARSAQAARAANPGFDASQVAAVDVDVRQNAYDEAKGRVFFRHLLDVARADAGVDSAALASFVPLTLIATPAARLAIEGYEPQRGEDLAFMFNSVSSDYFRTMRIPLVSGRPFEERDDDKAAPVMIVNRTLAERFWGGAVNAIGKRVRFDDKDWRTVIGVAADVKYLRVNEAPRPYVYVPFFQFYRSGMVLHTRGPAPVDGLVDLARAHVAALDGDLPILFAKPLAERLRGSAFIFFDLAAFMLFVFGAAGMALAALGTYGLVSYAIKQSTHEIGIRLALGASRPSVMRAFLGRGLRLGAIGAAIGMVVALGVTRMLGSALFGVSPTDVVSFTVALAIVLGVVILATIVPAWRASRMNPLSALRHQ